MVAIRSGNPAAIAWMRFMSDLPSVRTSAANRCQCRRPIFASDLHREFGLGEIDAAIGKNTRQIIKRSQADRTMCAEEQGIVLRVSVRSGDQPIECDGVQERLNIVPWMG